MGMGYVIRAGLKTALVWKGTSDLAPWLTLGIIKHVSRVKRSAIFHDVHVLNQATIQVFSCSRLALSRPPITAPQPQNCLYMVSAYMHRE